MMRSMYSGVAGLKTHQTKMDVIGNNIANVNTTSYKSQSVTFTDLLYQTTSKASGANATTGRAGTNAKQIGLGAQAGAFSTSITTAGATQTTGNPFDIKITGDAFFIVNDGRSNHFTRDGSFYVDGMGNLAMSSNGYNVMGWQVDESTGTIKKDTVTALRIMSAANMTYEPEATSKGYVSGILDKNETDASTTAGKAVNMSFYDALGYSYTAKFAIHETSTPGTYAVELSDILDSEGTSLKDVYKVNDISSIANFGTSVPDSVTELMTLATGYKYNYNPAATDPNEVYTYSKEVDYGQLFGDTYSSSLGGLTINWTPTKLNGATFPSGSGTLNALDKISMTGSTEVVQSTLENGLHLTYVGADDASNPTGVAYYQALDGTRLYDQDDATNVSDNQANWKAILGVELSDIQFASDGSSVKFTIAETEFTVQNKSTYSNNGTTFSFTQNVDWEEAYGLDTSDTTKKYSYVPAENGKAQVTTTSTYPGNALVFNTDTGAFQSINNGNSVTLDFNNSVTNLEGTTTSLLNFSDIDIDWSNTNWCNNNGASTISALSGEEGTGLGAGRKLGNMNGVSIDNTGKIYASYDNGMTRLLGQIAVAKFANASGLEKIGENLYDASLNSGEFDGIGVDISADGEGKMNTGCLEMSNVDLSAEFTDMITTQRGFQANSRIITVSDTMLEELINLKR